MSKTRMEPGTLLYPVPAVMVSCADRGGNANIIAIAWIGVLSSDPPVLGVGVRGSRHSHSLITDSGEFVVNIPTVDQVEALDYCGTVSGRDRDKFADTGLTAGKAATLLYAPVIEQCPVNLECRVIDRRPLGSHDCFMGEVVGVQVDDAWVDERGGLSLSEESLLAYVRGQYHRVGERLERGGFAARGD